MSPKTNEIYEFDDFRLDLREKTLSRGGNPVPITPKAFDTLAVLVENSGRLLEKNELMDLIWGDRFVEEGNLAFNIKVLRKVLRDDADQPRFIETVRRRGYRFIAPARRLPSAEEMAAESETGTEEGADPAGGALPQAASRNGPESGPDAVHIDKGGRRPLSASDIPKRKPGDILFRSIATVTLLLTLIGLGWYLTTTREAGIGDLSTRSSIRLTANGRTKSATVSPDGKFVAYITDDEGWQSIRLKNIATETDLEILPAGQSALGNLVFAPDGNQILYSNLGSAYRISILGGTPSRILNVSGNGFAIAPDGRRLAFIRYPPGESETSEMVIADVDGGNELVVASSVRPEIFLRSPTWSPDGGKIACAALAADGSQRVVVVGAFDGRVEQLPAPRWEIVYQVVWRKSSDGFLVLATLGDDIFFSQIWSLDYPTGEARNLTRDSNNYQSISLTADGRNLVAVRLEQTAHLWIATTDDWGSARQITDGFDKFDGIYALDWTANGRIVFETAANGKSALWTIDEDGRDARQIRSGTFATDASPDGAFVVFQGEKGSGLFRLNLPDGEIRRLTTGQDIWPAISPDKKWVVFTRYGEDVALWKVPADGGEAVKLTNLDGYPIVPAVSPDGASVAFYFTQNRTKAAPQVALVPIEGGRLSRSFDTPIQQPNVFWKTALQWSPDGSALDLVVLQNGVSNIWRQPLSGSSLFRLTDFKERRIFNFAYSPDGKRAVLSRGTLNRDAFLIPNP